MNDREIRCYSGEVRAERHDDNPAHIIGYGSVFDCRSELIFGSFREIIRPGAFDDVLGDDVRALFNHDPNFILGRSAAGTLNLSVDERGLRYDIQAPETQTIRDLVLAPMQRGDINQSSFAFRVRQMLFKALLGWNPEACGNPITYDGGTLLDLNRHELIYQFDFSVISELTEDDTRQQDDLNSLDELRTLAIDVDYLDPGNGPDGDIEHHTEITLPS